jgi:hypothetical protein
MDLQSLLWVPMWPFMLLLFLSIASVTFILFALIVSLFVRRIWCSRLQILCALFTITFGLTWFVVGRTSWFIRRTAFQRVAERGEALIQAIDTYRNQEDRLPESLNDLVPKYIEKIPRTGIRAYPDFEYEIPNSTDKYHTELYEKHNARYELKVYCPAGGANWDCFFYWPSEDYPDYIYGGTTEEIRKWVYVHE